MFENIIIAVLAIVIFCLVRSRIRKSTAERRMREYPNAMKGFFGFYNKVSCDNSNVVNQIVSKEEKFWQERERKEYEISVRCNSLKANYPNGWETWKQLGHQNNFEDLHIVDKECENIIRYETVFAQSQEYEIWGEKTEGSDRQCYFSSRI